LSELGWKGSSNDAGSFHVILINAPRPLDAVGHAESLEQSPVKLGYEEFQHVLVGLF